LFFFEKEKNMAPQYQRALTISKATVIAAGSGTAHITVYYMTKPAG